MNYKHLFLNDYSEGAHPHILELLQHSNEKQDLGYGEDSLTAKASELIRKEMQNPDAAVHLVTGGTQANLIVLSALLRPFESVIAATSAHISVHEAGAIEATGHKVCAVDSNDGKLTIEGIHSIVSSHSDEHMVKPRVVFISQATEVGTIYSKEELEKISHYCKEKKLYLYLDGARIGPAVCSAQSDLSLAEIAKLVDVFYIGGTKHGALLGEAIVITNRSLQGDFRYHLKQRGALLAKGRVLGAQFVALFEKGLFFELSHNANQMAMKLAAGISEAGFEFLTPSSTNQIFPIFPNSLITKLQELYGFYIWTKLDAEQSAIRLVTSWATKEEAVKEFITDLKKLML